MSFQGYGSLLSSQTPTLFRQTHSQCTSSLLSSEKGTSFFDGLIFLLGSHSQRSFIYVIFCHSVLAFHACETLMDLLARSEFFKG